MRLRVPEKRIPVASYGESQVESGHLVQVLEHHDRERYPNQLLYEVDVGGYIYVVPVVRDHQTLFLKTIYPSRKATRSRAKGRPS